jgi:hypothetical protein
VKTILFKIVHILDSFYFSNWLELGSGYYGNNIIRGNRIVKNGLLKYALILLIFLLITVIGFSNVQAWVNDIFDEDPQKNYAIADARDALSNILKLYPIDLSDKQAVANIRYKVDLAINSYNAIEIRNDSNYYFLEVAERRLEELGGSNQVPPNQTTSTVTTSPPAEDIAEIDYKKIALDNVVKEINNLPDPQSIELNDNNLNLVTSARNSVDLYIQDYDGKASDISNIQKLIALEEIIAEFEELANSEPDVEVLVTDVITEAISKLPSQEAITLADENLINNIRKLINYFIGINQIKEPEIESIDKLLEAERIIAGLNEKEEIDIKRQVQGLLSFSTGILFIVTFLIFFYRKYYPEKLVISRSLIIYTLIFIALATGTGAALLYNNNDPAPTNREAHIGTWKSGEVGNEVFFQFLDNERIRIYVIPQKHWFEAKYRIASDGSKSFLELYHDNIDNWESSAFILVISDIMVIHNLHTGTIYQFRSASNAELTDLKKNTSLENLNAVGAY